MSLFWEPLLWKRVLSLQSHKSINLFFHFPLVPSPLHLFPFPFPLLILSFPYLIFIQRDICLFLFLLLPALQCQMGWRNIIVKACLEEMYQRAASLGCQEKLIDSQCHVEIGVSLNLEEVEEIDSLLTPWLEAAEWRERSHIIPTDWIWGFEGLIGETMVLKSLPGIRKTLPRHEMLKPCTEG